MQASRRKAIKRETMIQSLSLSKVEGTVDDRLYARRKLSNGVSSRYTQAQRLGRCDATDVILGGRKIL